MKKGIDYIGVCVAFYCHDGKGNYLFHKRSQQCRDEQGHWDFGGGGLKFGESVSDGVQREVFEEYGTEPLAIEFLSHADVFREIEGQKSHWIVFRHRVLLARENVINNEPEKHEELGWFTLNNLPDPLHSQIGYGIETHKDQLI